MNGRIFIDSNVFLYAIEEDATLKGERCGEWLRHLLRSALGLTSLQVMNEITNVLLKRGKIPPEQAFSIVDGFQLFGTVAINLETVAAARLIHFETGYSWWDSLLLAAAIEQGCAYFLSEDLQDSRRIRGLTIISPFRHSPAQILH